MVMETLPTSSEIKRIVIQSQEGKIYIFFGSDPEKHAPFEAAAWYLHKRLSRIYKNSKVIVNSPENIESSGRLMKFLLENRISEANKILEIHLFSHSWDLGLSLKFGGFPTDQDLKDLEDVYGTIVRQKEGNDDYEEFHPTQFRISNFRFLTEKQIRQLRQGFRRGAIVRFWGCYTGSGTDDSSPYPNYANIAETFAQYAGIETYGSPSGAEFYAYVDGKWTTKYSKKVRSKAEWPFELRSPTEEPEKFSPTLSISELDKLELWECWIRKQTQAIEVKIHSDATFGNRGIIGVFNSEAEARDEAEKRDPGYVWQKPSGL